MTNSLLDKERKINLLCGDNIAGYKILIDFETGENVGFRLKSE
jgi:hypothetical protein